MLELSEWKIKVKKKRRRRVKGGVEEREVKEEVLLLRNLKRCFFCTVDTHCFRNKKGKDIHRKLRKRTQ